MTTSRRTTWSIDVGGVNGPSVAMTPADVSIIQSTRSQILKLRVLSLRPRFVASLACLHFCVAPSHPSYLLTRVFFSPQSSLPSSKHTWFGYQQTRKAITWTRSQSGHSFIQSKLYFCTFPTRPIPSLLT